MSPNSREREYESEPTRKEHRDWVALGKKYGPWIGGGAVSLLFLYSVGSYIASALDTSGTQLSTQYLKVPTLTSTPVVAASASAPSPVAINRDKDRQAAFDEMQVKARATAISSDLLTESMVDALSRQYRINFIARCREQGKDVCLNETVFAQRELAIASKNLVEILGSPDPNGSRLADGSFVRISRAPVDEDRYQKILKLQMYVRALQKVVSEPASYPTSDVDTSRVIQSLGEFSQSAADYQQEKVDAAATAYQGGLGTVVITPSYPASPAPAPNSSLGAPPAP